MRQTATVCDSRFISHHLRGRAIHSVALHRGWWWAQNRAHSFGVHPCSETVFDGHTCTCKVCPSQLSHFKGAVHIRLKLFFSPAHGSHAGWRSRTHRGTEPTDANETAEVGNYWLYRARSDDFYATVLQPNCLADGRSLSHSAQRFQHNCEQVFYVVHAREVKGNGATGLKIEKLVEHGTGSIKKVSKPSVTDLAVFKVRLRIHERTRGNMS
jgi:hypothetical protein